ncbi:hypothetical protein ACWDZ8_25010, partial [Streptomyces sp. NPDC003233]
LDGKVVVDVSNPLAFEDGQPRLDPVESDSVAVSPSGRLSCHVTMAAGSRWAVGAGPALVVAGGEPLWPLAAGGAMSGA